jgi:hypothetical protein
VSGSVVTSSGARVFASEVEPPAPRLSEATAQRSPARKSLRFMCSYCWLAGRLGSVKAVASLLFHLLPRERGDNPRRERQQVPYGANPERTHLSPPAPFASQSTSATFARLVEALRYCG